MGQQYGKISHREAARLKEVSDNDVSTSSLSNYTHTDDIRKMFAKTPAGLADQQLYLKKQEKLA